MDQDKFNEMYPKIDNITYDGTASDDMWVTSADYNGKEMTIEQLDSLTSEQNHELILKAKGIW